MPFQKGNKLGTGRPKGSKNKAHVLKDLLLSLCLTPKMQKAIRELDAEQLLKYVAPMLPKEQTVHQDTSPIQINIDKSTKKEAEKIPEKIQERVNPVLPIEDGA